MPKSIDLESLLDKTFHSIDTILILSDLEDFINFSERNIDWQKRREIHNEEIACANEHFDEPHEKAQFHDQTISGVIYRFDVNLTQRVRYAALVALITTIEWALLSLEERLDIKAPRKQKGTSEAIHLLKYFSKAASTDLSSKIQTIETLIQARNCIVHAAGLISSYKHGPALRQRLTNHSGIRVSDIHFLGESIEIEKNHLQYVVEDVKHWLPDLENSMQTKGLLRKWR